MNSIAVIDTASAVVFLAALFCSARIPERVLDERSRRLMMAGLGTVVQGSSKELENLLVYVMRVCFVDDLGYAERAAAVEDPTPN